MYPVYMSECSLHTMYHLIRVEQDKNCHSNMFYGDSVDHSHGTVVYQQPGMEMVMFKGRLR